MTWFKLCQIYICKEINKVNRDFFWNDKCDNNNEKHKLYSLSWDKICGPKCERGLGVRCLEDINTAY